MADDRKDKRTKKTGEVGAATLAEKRDGRIISVSMNRPRPPEEDKKTKD